MEKIPKISEAEWQVMKLLWKSSPLTSEKIIQGLSPKHSWSEQTIKTFITRLVNKEVISLLLTKFLEDKDLSMDQIEQLERVLKEKRESQSSDESENL